MTEDNKQTKKRTGVSPITNIITILFSLIVIGFIGYKSYEYFNSEGNLNFPLFEAVKENILATSTTREESEPSILDVDTTEENTINDDTIENNNLAITQEYDWVANDYKEGDVEGTTYTVIYGDTLWEIADGMTGNPYNWTDILSLNADQIDHLPSGQQALIYPGQVLTLPTYY